MLQLFDDIMWMRWSGENAFANDVLITAEPPKPSTVGSYHYCMKTYNCIDSQLKWSYQKHQDGFIKKLEQRIKSML